MPRKKLPKTEVRSNKRRKLYIDARYMVTLPAVLPEEDLMLPTCILMDLSRQGAMLKIPPSVSADIIENADPVTKRLFLRFFLKGTLIEFHGKFEWKKRGPLEQLYIGVSLENPSEDLVHLITRLLFNAPTINFEEMRRKALRKELAKNTMKYFIGPVCASAAILLMLIAVNAVWARNNGNGDPDLALFQAALENRDFSQAQIILIDQNNKGSISPDMYDRINPMLNPDDPDAREKLERAMEYWERAQK